MTTLRELERVGYKIETVRYAVKLRGSKKRYTKYVLQGRVR